ncbi:MAG: hypothetical protein P4L40_11115 [Terracidiphilus sp.]|nr:hypothetical protein [Terracidiphilus sp.]
MTEESQPQSPQEDRKNPAVERCCRAWQLAYDREMELEEDEEEMESDYEARKAANRAFCDAMPPLAGQQNIRDFIACIACGLLKGAISYMDSPRLLYAAQIAVSADGSPRPPRK